MEPYVKGRMHIDANQTSSKIIGLFTTQPKPGSTLERLETDALAALASRDKVKARAKEHEASGRFTPAGAKQATLQSALSEGVPSLYRARQTIKKAKAERDALRSKVSLAQPAQTEVAEMQRREMRDWFRSKPQAERDALTSRPDKLDPRLLEALIDMPIEMTGIAATHRDLLIERALEAQHGEDIAAIKELDRGIEVAERYTDTSRDEVRKETGVDQKTFDELAAPIEAKQNVAWLRRRPGSDEVRVVDLERGIERLPTPEELSSGIEATTLDEFNERKTA